MQKACLILLVIAATAMLLFMLFRGDEMLTVDQAGEVQSAQHPASNEIPPAPVPDDGLPPMVPEEELPAGTRIVTGKLSDERFTRLNDGRSLSNEGYAIARKIHQPELPPEEDLQHLNSVIGLYQWAYQEVPEGGENYEIMGHLTGDNPHRVVFFPPDPERFDAEGNLLDRWGTPYFMHKMSDQEIDILSAGPDRRLWSNDDLSLGFLDDFQTASSE